MKKPISKILFFRLDACLGDTVVDLFVIRELKKNFPNVHLTLATFAAHENFFKHNPHIDRLITLPALGAGKDRYLTPGVCWGLIKMWLLSYLGRYDWVLVNPKVLTPRNRLYCKLLHHAIIPQMDYTRPVSVSYERLLKQLGATHVNTAYELPLCPPHRAYARAFCEQYHLTPGKFWALNPTGATEERTLAITQLNALLTALQTAGYPGVVLDYKNQFTALGPAAVRCTTNGVLETAAVLEQAAGVISVDTGIVHVAEALHKKMLVLFAHDRYSLPPNNHVFWASRQPTTRWVQSPGSVKELPPQTLLEALAPLLIR